MLILFGFCLPLAAFLGFLLGYHERRLHRQEDEAAAYNKAHGEGFDDGWAASETVHRALRQAGKAYW